jgi:hypothetical protein
MGGMNKLTLPGDPLWDFGGAAASSQIEEADRRQQLVGSHHPGGVRRCLFGVGGGPTEAAAEAKQENMGWRRFVSILCQSLLASLSWRHLSLTCQPLVILVCY